MEGGVEVTVLVRPGAVWKFEVVVVVGKRRILWRPVLFVVAYDRKRRKTNSDKYDGRADDD